MLQKASKRLPITIERAKSLRRTQTQAERLLWRKLRDRRLRGLKFRRQYAIGPYIADFCCPEQNLIIELDGTAHEGREVYDRRRENWLIQEGYAILRFRNGQVIESIDWVLGAIVEKTKTTNIPSPAAAGEG